MIPYNYTDDMLVAEHRDLLITDGTVTVSGTGYTVSNDTVTITNPMIEEEAFELHQSLCSDTQIRFGSCEAAEVSFVIYENLPTLKNKTIKVYLIPNSDASKMLQLGVYKVDEDKLSADRTKRTIRAYDAMYDILNADLTAFYNATLPNKSTTMTLAQFRAALFTYLNISVVSTTLVNDSMTVRRTIEPETLSGADVIRAICEINGVFGTITNEGKFKFVELTPGLDDGLFPSDTLYPADDLYPQDINHDVTVLHHSYYLDVEFEDYISESITQLTIRTDDEDVGITVGTSGNGYVITGNFLVYGIGGSALTTIATNALSKITNRYYKPCTLNAIGNPLHEVGDGIRIRTTYRGIVTYILDRRLSGIQALRDTYTAQGEQYSSEDLNSVSSQFKQIANKTLKIQQDVNEVSAELTEQLDDTVQGSYAYQTAQEIGLKVSKSNIVSDLNNKMSGITIRSDAIEVSSSGTFTVDATNFSLDSNGNAKLTAAELKSCTVKTSLTVNGDITMGTAFKYTSSTDTLKMFDDAIYVSSNYLMIDGSQGSDFNNVSITGSVVHVGYDSTQTRIYNCDMISASDNVGSGNARIVFDDTNGTTAIYGQTSGIRVDSGYSSYGILLDGSVDVGGGSSNTVRIKGKDVKWVSETINGTSYKILVED